MVTFYFTRRVYCDKKRGGERGVWKKIAFFSPFYCSLDRYWLHVEPAHIWLYSLVYLVSSEYLLLHFAVPKSPFHSFVKGFCFFLPSLCSPYFFFTSMYVCPFFLLTSFAFSPTFVKVACLSVFLFFSLLASVITVGRGKRKRAHHGVEVRLDNLNKKSWTWNLFFVVQKNQSS